MDVRTGGIVAMASWPSYDPNIWVGGISTKDYKSITSKKNNYPNQSRAFQGEFAPASTFKAVTLPAAVKAGYSVNGSYDCPSAYSIGGTPKRNYESQGYGVISMHRAIEVSCDTVFYKFAYETWLRMGGLKAKKNAKDPFTQMAKAFGLGRTTGLDLPGESDGRIADRAWKRAYWKATKDFYCAKAKTGYPEVASKDPRRAAYLVQLSKENCADGCAYRGGDAANFAIGQGDTTTTPLQMARVYAAVANGGTLVTPHIGRAVITPEGELVRQIEPEPAGRVPASAATLKWLRRRAARRDRGRHRLRAVRARGVPADQGAGRGQDRHRRGLRQADDVVVRVLRAGEQAAVRRGDDGQPGRHRLRRLGAVGRRALQDPVRRQRQDVDLAKAVAPRRAPDDRPAGGAPRRHRDDAGERAARCRPGARPARLELWAYRRDEGGG